MATHQNPHSLTRHPRRNAPLTAESFFPVASGIAGYEERWPILSKLQPEYAETIRLFYVFAPPLPGVANVFLVTRNDEVWGFRTNDHGCLGPVNENSCTGPIKVAALCGKAVKSFAHGMKHLLALTGKGEVYAWNQREAFKVGEAHLEKKYPLNLVYSGEDPAVEIACGNWHSTCRTEEGDIYCWGLNGFGQTGIGFESESQTPRKVSLVTRVKCIGISCMANSTVAVLENGEVYAWGENVLGQLGIGSDENSAGPVKLDLEKIIKVVCGSQHSLALDDDGSVYVWGSNARGQLGLRFTEVQRKTIFHSALRDSYGKICDIAASGDTSAVMTEKSKVLMWGANERSDLKCPTEASCTSLQDVFANSRRPVTPLPIATMPISSFLVNG